MDDPVTYNIPVGLVEAYRGRSLVVRTERPSEIVRAIPPERFADISYVRLSSFDAEVDDLVHWGVGIPVDVVMRRPLSEFMRLYRFAKLLENHPVRISVPVVAGFGRAARLALALNFAVKLEVTEQPGPDLIDELYEVLNLYLYRPSVSQPVEFFHSLFLAFYRWELATLWEIQEEDPAHFRHVTDDGEEVSPRRAPRGGARDAATVAGTADYRRELLAEGAECAGCEFFSYCGGYFKWPARDYDCAGIRTLFGALSQAAGELRGDVEAYAATAEEARS
jgi:hypothetical protein